MSEVKKQRGKKTTTEQMGVIIDFFENNSILISGKCHPMQPDMLEKKWDELVDLLNGVANGAKKDKKQWKTFLSEWKSKTKKKARIAKNSLIKTGGGSYNIDELTEIENRLLKVLGWVSIVGCEGLPPEIDPDCGYVRAGNIDEEIVFENDHDEDYNNEIIEEIIILPMENENEPQNLVPTDHPERKFSKGSIRKTSKIYQTKSRGMKTPTRMTSSSQLEKSAELYAKSSEDMAGAIKEMAVSISKLADALLAISSAITDKIVDKTST